MDLYNAFVYSISLQITVHVQVQVRMSFSEKASVVRVFFIVSFLIGVTLCSLQFMSYFTKTDSFAFGLNNVGEIKRVQYWTEVIFIMFHSLFPGIIILFKGNEKGMLFALFSWIVYSFIIFVFFVNFKVAVPVTAPAIGSLLSIVRILGLLTTFLEDEKEDVKNTFKHFLEPKVVDYFLKNKELANETAIMANVTVFFGDLRGFSKLCDVETPEFISKLLRQYFGKIIPIVHKHGGTVDKLMGDGIMVVFGYPESSSNHAENAVHAAGEMQAAMQPLLKTWAEKYDLQIGFGIGINTDNVVISTIGSQDFYDHTVLGQGVNIAARIEAFCPGGEVHVSKKTFELSREKFNFKYKGSFGYKNHQNAIDVYSLIVRDFITAESV